MMNIVDIIWNKSQILYCIQNKKILNLQTSIKIIIMLINMIIFILLIHNMNFPSLISRA
jgi:hypothetical protein